MCGITGIFSSSSLVRSDILENMVEVLNHRGPDGKDIFVDGNIGLGHTRLKIIDLSDRGKQPMTSSDGNHTIVFNGEIYNYLELQKTLIGKGYKFRTSTDTEVILYSYQEYGPKCLNFFNGMFAFAIWDKVKKELFCARDRFGIKPFYYTLSNGEFIFSSEIKGILKNPNYSIKENKSMISDYLRYGLMDHTNETMFNDIYQLRPSTYFRVSKNGLVEKTYYKLKASNFNNFNKKNLLSLLESSTKLRMRSDVPVGLLLSGGLDSSTIAFYMDKILSDAGNLHDIQTFSSVSDVKEVDESPYLEEMVKTIKAKKNKIKPEGKNLISKLKKIIWHHDEPVLGSSIFAHWHLMKKVNETDIVVLLQGQGADEIFYGYEWYDAVYISELIRNIRFKEAASEIRKISKRNGVSKLSLLRKSLENFIPIKALFSFKSKFLGSYNFFRYDYEPCLDHLKQSSQTNLLKRSHSDINFINLPYILHYEDRNSMAFSKECRVPFLDYRLVEYAYSLSNKFKIDGDKRKLALSLAMESILPPKIIGRKKKFGFVTPMDKWLREDSREDISNTFSSKKFRSREVFNSSEISRAYTDYCNGENKFRHLIWRSLALEMWYNVYFDN